jgi:transketolase
VIICDTVKGKGVDFMEGDLEWHYRPVRGEDVGESLLRLADA